MGMHVFCCHGNTSDCVHGPGHDRIIPASGPEVRTTGSNTGVSRISDRVSYSSQSYTGASAQRYCNTRDRNPLESQSVRQSSHPQQVPYQSKTTVYLIIAQHIYSSSLSTAKRSLKIQMSYISKNSFLFTSGCCLTAHQHNGMQTTEGAQRVLYRTWAPTNVLGQPSSLPIRFFVGARIFSLFITILTNYTNISSPISILLLMASWTRQLW